MLNVNIRLYADRDDVVLQTYILADSPELTPGKPRPAVLICPGGAYLGTSDREAEPIALQFNAHGYQAFVLRYSTFYRGNMKDIPAAGSPVPGNRRARYPEPLLDLARAMLVIAGNAGLWLVDPDRVAVCGFSAGGHLAASLGVHWAEPWLSEALGLEAGSTAIRPAAMILGYPLTDFVANKQKISQIKALDPAAVNLWHAVNLAVFENPEPADADLLAASPARQVGRLTPPAFIWHTANDRVVPVDNSLNLAAALAEQGISFELHIFRHGSHGLALADETTAALPEQINQPVQAWLRLALTWLDSLLRNGD